MGVDVTVAEGGRDERLGWLPPLVDLPSIRDAEFVANHCLY
jgi:hypothetical protein